MNRANSPGPVQFIRQSLARSLKQSICRPGRRRSQQTTAEAFEQRQIAIVIPKGGDEICGVKDYAVGLAMTFTIFRCDVKVFAIGSIKHKKSHLLAGIQSLAQLYRMKPRLIAVNYVQFGYGILPIQPLVPIMAILASFRKQTVLTIWHEPPELGAGCIRTVRRLLERSLCRSSDVILLADARFAGELRNWGAKDVRISPIPSPFESSLYSQPPQSGLAFNVLLFGIYSVGKGFSAAITEALVSILKRTVPKIELLAVGINWKEFPVQGIIDLGPANEGELRDMANRISGAVFPMETPITAKSSAVSAMLTLGIPVIATGHIPVGCPACSYYRGAVTCLSSPVEAAEELVRLGVDMDYRAERILHGREWYLKTSSWSRVSEVLSQCYGNDAVDWLLEDEVDLPSDSSLPTE